MNDNTPDTLADLEPVDQHMRDGAELVNMAERFGEWLTIFSASETTTPAMVERLEVFAAKLAGVARTARYRAAVHANGREPSVLRDADSILEHACGELQYLAGAIVGPRSDFELYAPRDNPGPVVDSRP